LTAFPTLRANACEPVPADWPPTQHVGRLNALRILEGISCAECAVRGDTWLCGSEACTSLGGCSTHHVLTSRPGVWAGRSALVEQSRVRSAGDFAAQADDDCAEVVEFLPFGGSGYPDEDQRPLPQRLEQSNSVLSHARRPKITTWWPAWPSMPRLPYRIPC